MSRGFGEGNCVTPLWLALKDASSPEARGEDGNGRDRDGLYGRSNLRRAAIATLLLDAGAVPTVGPDGATPLHHAAMSACVPLVAALLAAGGSVDPRTEQDGSRLKSEGWTPLMMCMTDDTEDYGGGDSDDDDDDDDDGGGGGDEKAALARALRRTRGDCGVAALLIEAKADLDAKKART